MLAQARRQPALQQERERALAPQPESAAGLRVFVLPGPLPVVKLAEPHQYLLPAVVLPQPGLARVVLVSVSREQPLPLEPEWAPQREPEWARVQALPRLVREWEQERALARALELELPQEQRPGRFLLGAKPAMPHRCLRNSLEQEQEPPPPLPRGRQQLSASPESLSESPRLAPSERAPREEDPAFSSSHFLFPRGSARHVLRVKEQVALPAVAKRPGPGYRPSPASVAALLRWLRGPVAPPVHWATAALAPHKHCAKPAKPRPNLRCLAPRA